MFSSGAAPEQALELAMTDRIGLCPVRKGDDTHEPVLRKRGRNLIPAFHTGRITIEQDGKEAQGRAGQSLKSATCSSLSEEPIRATLGMRKLCKRMASKKPSTTQRCLQCFTRCRFQSSRRL